MPANKVWLSEFSCLRFRERSQHSQCPTCVRHRCMVRQLGRHTAARKAQLKYFHEHLRAQYNDRCLYWEARGLSRGGYGLVTLICDGMDQCKWELPRDAALASKEFGSLVKVKVHVAACIAHGKKRCQHQCRNVGRQFHKA